MLRLTARQFAQLQRGAPIGPARKFFNVPTVVDAVPFDSAHEARHYQTLCQRLHAGAIRDLTRQRVLPLVVNGQRVATIRVDFVYDERSQPQRGLFGTTWTWTTVYEDAKSTATRTPVWRVKAKLFTALYGVAIREVLNQAQGRRRRRRRGAKGR